jgi:succinyl-CoA synthetase alpha subunit
MLREVLRSWEARQQKRLAKRTFDQFLTGVGHLGPAFPQNCIGVSTLVGIGGDPVNGSSFRVMLELFEKDPGRDAVLMIGEIGGPQEAEAALWARDHMNRPLSAYRRAFSPKGRRMGYGTGSRLGWANTSRTAAVLDQVRQPFKWLG